MTYHDLNTIFGSHLSRNEANTITALHEAGYCLDDLQELIEIGAVRILDFGYGQIHYERRIFSEKSFEELSVKMSN